MKTRSPFLNNIVDFMLSRQYSLRTIDTYLKWIASFIHFHGKRHPASMGDNEVVEYLDSLVLNGNVIDGIKLTLISIKANRWQ